MTYYINGGEILGNIISSSIPDNQAVNGDIIYGVVGEDVEFGNTVYLNSDGKFYKAAAVFGKCPAVGMIANTRLSGSTTLILLRGFIRNDSWIFGTDIGGDLYLDKSVSGEMNETDPGNEYNQIVARLFVSNDNPRKTVVYFDP